MLGVLVRRGNDFAAAGDAVQDALLEACRSWGDAPPGEPLGWLLTTRSLHLALARRILVLGIEVGLTAAIHLRYRAG